MRKTVVSIILGLILAVSVALPATAYAWGGILNNKTPYPMLYDNGKLRVMPAKSNLNIGWPDGKIRVKFRGGCQNMVNPYSGGSGYIVNLIGKGSEWRTVKRGLLGTTIRTWCP